MKKRKLAIVMSGGGMRCVYGAGALGAILEYYKFTEPYLLIAASGSAGGATYYLSGQGYLGAALWIQETSGNKVISFARRRFLDVDYLVDKVFKAKYPFDFKALARSKTIFLIPAMRIADGETVYLQPPANQSMYEYLRAAKAVPVAYGKTVLIGNDRYIDGDFGATTEDFVKKAVSMGATDIIVLESNPDGDEHPAKRFALQLIKLGGRFSKDVGLRKAATRDLLSVGGAGEYKNVRVVRITPKKKLPVIFTTTNQSRLRAAWNQGYDEAVASKELRHLLHDSH
jgi:predicted patatin/cPLA2 family phospholipase